MNLIRFARVHWDRVGGGVLIAVGGVFILVGWNRVGGEALTAQQIPYVISGGIGGLFLLGVGAMLWLSADLRDEWRKLDAIDRHMAEHAVGHAEAADDDPFLLTARESATRANGSRRRAGERLRAGREPR